MAYSDFTLEAIETQFGLPTVVAPLFDGGQVVAPPAWLTESLARGMTLPLVSEKMRGELLVMPVLLAVRELLREAVVVYSGARLDADPGRGLAGECDFMMSRGQPLPEVQPPVLTLVEAKRDFIESGLGQCAAQMVGARVFNERRGKPILAVYGCVTTGDRWQFLRLEGATVTVDARLYYLNELDRILGVFHAILAEPEGAPR